MRKFINPSKIVRIEAFDRRESTSVMWFPEKKILFGLFTYKEGFWTTELSPITFKYTRRSRINDDELKDYYKYEFVGQVCYDKPRIEVESRLTWDVLYFNTSQEMDEYLNQPELRSIKLVEM